MARKKSASEAMVSIVLDEERVVDILWPIGVSAYRMTMSKGGVMTPPSVTMITLPPKRYALLRIKNPTMKSGRIVGDQSASYWWKFVSESNPGLIVGTLDTNIELHIKPADPLIPEDSAREMEEDDEYADIEEQCQATGTDG